MKWEAAQIRVLDHLREFSGKDEWCSISAVMRETGVSEYHIYAIIRVLKLHGVITTERKGNAVVLSLARI
jgi:DNA-binding transcriptional ArsR family regulator